MKRVISQWGLTLHCELVSSVLGPAKDLSSVGGARLIRRQSESRRGPPWTNTESPRCNLVTLRTHHISSASAHGLGRVRDSGVRARVPSTDGWTCYSPPPVSCPTFPFFPQADGSASVCRPPSCRPAPGAAGITRAAGYCSRHQTKHTKRPA